MGNRLLKIGRLVRALPIYSLTPPATERAVDPAIHRSRIMQKMKANSLADLVRMAVKRDII